MNHDVHGGRVAPCEARRPLLAVCVWWTCRERSDRGATATEYAILVAFIALLIILGVSFFGGSLNSWFHRLGASIEPYTT